jgi:hypothetical protein
VRARAEVLESGRVAIHAARAVYVLEPTEIVAILPTCKSLWILAARRGKLHRRAAAAARRSAKEGQFESKAAEGQRGGSS